MFRRRRPLRLTPQGKIVIGIIFFVLLVIVFSAIASRCKSPKQEVHHQPVEIEIEQTRTIDVYLDGSVIEMKLEEYLIGVVAAEMPASFEPEALKAQAVAARTFTLYKANNGGCSAHQGADICTESSHCQAYVTKDQMRTNWGGNYDKYFEKISHAVSSTSGEVMLYEGEEIQVFYHASAGGQTENCENVYQEALPYLVSVSSYGEENSSHYYGEVRLSKADFAAKMKIFSSSIIIEDVSSCIGAIKRYESGRVESIEIGNETFTGREIRSIFRLNSTNFTINIDETVVFNTIGFGHGVGMSQEGANAMAKNGAGYMEILTHYYTGITIN